MSAGRWEPKLPFSCHRNKYDEWQVTFPYDEGGMLCPIASDGIDGPPPEFREAVARFIVRACNSHYELLEALQNFRLAAEYWAGCDEGRDADTASSEIMSSGGAWPAEAYDKAIDAIAKATGA